jgi:hypothetical protein
LLKPQGATVQLGGAPAQALAWPITNECCGHIAVQESLDGKNVEWMKHVTDA